MMARRGQTHARVVPLVWLSLVIAAGCRGPELSREPVRLVDQFAAASVIATPELLADTPRTEWVFDGADPSPFEVVRGADIRLEDGELRGRATSAQPVLVAERVGEISGDELLHSVEIRARVSGGTRMSVFFDDGPTLVVPRAIENETRVLATPVRPGDEMRTYVIRPPSAREASTLDRILIVPTDERDAEFAIDSVRLVFRDEYLSSIPSGVGWHGMSDIYRESIVSRAPESVRFQLVLPASPSLDLAVATTDDSPVRFTVEVTPLDGAEPRSTSTETMEPRVWKPLILDLESLAGERVEVALSLSEGAPGALGFWGSPVIRSTSLDDNGKPRGVILVITDTLRSDHLPFHGYGRDTAPTLTRLGDEGVRFTDTVSQGTWTKVSVTAIQSSLYPTTHTVVDIPDRLPASAQTVAEAYRSAGYRTFGVASIPWVGQNTNLHQGYEEYHESRSLGRGFKRASEAVDRLSDWLDGHHQEPFFALLHVSDPHSPFRPTPEFETAFAEPGEMDRLDALVEQVRDRIPPGPLRRFGMASLEELEAAAIDPEEFVRLEKAGYDGSILGMDAALSRLVAKLEQLELSDRVLVGVVSDHGTEFLEHGEHFHGHSPYGELNRVPMLLWGPGFVAASSDVTQTVQTIDLVPTLLDLSGLSAADTHQGRSLVPFFSGSLQARALPAITEAISDDGLVMTSLIWDGWKLVEIVDPKKDSEPRLELYDHVEDPLNLSDVASEHRDRVQELAVQLDGWRKFAVAARLDDARAAESMDSEELERLRSLGYIQ